MSNYQIGSHVVEGVAAGTSSVGIISKRNIGIVGLFQRGVPNKPTKITSLEEFKAHFGEISPSFYGPAFVKNIFDEAGNADVILYVLRYMNEDDYSSLTAKGTLLIPLDKSGKQTTSGGSMEFSAGYEGNEDPGEWANDTEVTFSAFGSRGANNFRVTIKNGDNTETFNANSIDELKKNINDASSYVVLKNIVGTIPSAKLTDLSGYTSAVKEADGTTTITFSSLPSVALGDYIYTASGTQVGAVINIDQINKKIVVSGQAEESSAYCLGSDYSFSVALAGGKASTTNNITLTDSVLNNFKGTDIQIITYTDSISMQNTQQLNKYATEQNILAVACMPLNSSLSDEKVWYQTFSTNGISHLAVYNVWCYIYDESYNRILIPGTAAILGAAYLKNAYLQGDGIHIPPGGTDGAFTTVISTIPDDVDQNFVDKSVQSYFVNVVRHDANYGYYVCSSRTMSSNKLYMSIHIRLQTSYYCRYLESLLLPYTQKPNTPEMKNRMLIDCRNFFKSEYSAGALENSLSFDKAYQGICDSSNNPKKQDRKLVNIDCLYVPTECTEAIRLRLLRNDSILTASEES
jgi:hypothetical protein